MSDIKSKEINGKLHYAKPITLGGYNAIKRVASALLSGCNASGGSNVGEAINAVQIDIAKVIMNPAEIANVTLMYGLCDKGGKQLFKTVEALEDGVNGGDSADLLALVYEANPALKGAQTESVEEAEKN